MHLKISSAKWRPFCPEEVELMRHLTIAQNRAPHIFSGDIFKFILFIKILLICIQMSMTIVSRFQLTISMIGWANSLASNRSQTKSLYKPMFTVTHMRHQAAMGECTGSHKPPGDHFNMMTSSNGNIFRVTGHLSGEFTSGRWTPRTKASDAELWCFLWCVPE